MRIPDDLQYTITHKWVRIEGDIAVVGITDYAQDTLGDIVYVDLPEIGSSIDADTEMTTVESVKANTAVFAPCTGEIVEVNSTLLDDPELINDDPYGTGWIVKIRFATLPSLRNAGAYEKYIDEIVHY